MKRVFVLAHAEARRNAQQCIAAAPDGYCVTVGEPTRSLEQNAKFHAILGDFSAQLQFAGKRRTPDQWKMLMISGHAVATNLGSEMMPGLEGEWVNMRESSARMSVQRLSSLIEYSIAYGALNDVKFSA